MQFQMKRSLSALLALVLILSFFSGLTVPARAAQYLYNWGYRGETAASLSESAVAFYDDNDISYETLAVLSGSSDLDAVPESQLYDALQQLMKDNHSYINNYADVKDFCQYTDCEGGGGKISSFYSGVSIGPDWDGGKTWNREHTWPNSKGLGGDDENDIMMLRPTSVSENSGRGNTAYGEGTGYYDPNKASSGAYDLHGDVARIALYVYTRWGNTDYMWNSYGVMESKEVLLRWMAEDPVDTWELGRNDVVQSITGTRNVYIDYPELAFLLFGEEIPTNMATPSGNAKRAHTVTVTVNDETMGSATLTGNTIEAAPAEGFSVSGCEIISGAATAERSGNTFTVSAFTDCTIQINFAPKSTVKVTYTSDGTVLSVAQTRTDDSVILPDYTGTAPQGCTFLGWSDVPVLHSKQQPALYQPGDSYTVASDTTMYALFSYVGAGGDDGIWKKVTDSSDLAAGCKIILACAKGDKTVVSGALNGKILSEVITTFSEDGSSVTALPENAQYFTLGGSEGAWTLSNEEGKKLGAYAVKCLAYDSGTTTWKITIVDGNATIQNGTQNYGRFLYNSSSPRFTTYTSNTTSSMLLPYIFMLDSSAGITYYSTEKPQELPGGIIGDVNGDGSVTVSDLMRLANYFAKDAEINRTNADVTGDGNVTVVDLMRLANYFAGKATLG